MRAVSAPQYQTKELSDQTWPDFEKLFSQGHGWNHCWCMAFQRVQHASRKQFRTRAEVAVSNQQAKKELVDQGQAHGILVYADGAPIGWCQYGSAEELNGYGQPEPTPAQNSARVWRVTCFVVERKHRRKGIAGLALHAALQAIRERGGGLVEAYPVVCWSHGQTGSAGATYVQGIGPIGSAWGSFGNVSTSGIASMFEKEGFEAVGVCGPASARVRSQGAHGSHLLMRKLI